MTDKPLKETPAPLQTPSQDPRLAAQQPIDAETAERETNSIAMGGGMAAGAAAGAATGAVLGGPVGVLVGGTVGAILGALGGYAAVDATDPDYTYWKEAHVNQPDYVSGYSYDTDYAPAYRLGYQGRSRYAGRTWDDMEAALAKDWVEIKGDSRLSWDQARAASRAAWDRQA
ncbi:MAG: hypothetical protein Q4G70_05150 [Pseudomonadota bacterium]|nr:hypothetical protein [Pseudomonadota bacterium]